MSGAKVRGNWVSDLKEAVEPCWGTLQGTVGVDVVCTGMERNFIPGWREFCPRMEWIFVLGQRYLQGLSVLLGCRQSVHLAQECW